MKISKVKLVNGGLKGLEVSYEKVEEKDGREYRNEYVQKRRFPVSGKLEEVVNGFRWYLLDVYGFEMSVANVAEVEVLGVSGDEEGFVISGKMKVLGGDKVVGMNTPYLKEGDYEKWGEVDKLVGQLYGEVGEYMEGKSEINENQLVMKFWESKGKDMEEYAGMSDREKKEEATRVLEKMGSIVIHNEDMEEGDVVEEVKEKGSAKGVSEVDKFIEKAKEKKGIVGEVKEEESGIKGLVVEYDEVPNFGEEEEFSVPVTPVKLGRK